MKEFGLLNHRQLLKEYNFHNKMYYDLNKPKISDEKFDTLKSELLIFEKTNNLKVKTVENNVGYKPSITVSYTHLTLPTKA